MTEAAPRPSPETRKDGGNALKCGLSLHAPLPSRESLADVDDRVRVHQGVAILSTKTPMVSATADPCAQTER
jgi:hypothetical protein